MTTMRVRHCTFLGAMLLGLAACSEPVGPPEPPPHTGHIEVDSDPPGARIFVDGRDRSKVTPDTLHGLSGAHEISVQIDSAGATYGYRVQLFIPRDTVVRITGPLTLPRCNDQQCPLISEQTVSRIRFSRSQAGPLFFRAGSGQGAFWPSTTTNSYVSTGLPLFAMTVGENAFALGIYDHLYLAGRPFPSLSNSGAFSLRQSFWLIPPPGFPTVRGLEVTEEVIGAVGVDDAVVLRLVFRNITNQPAYRAADGLIPEGGITFQEAFVGFALDPDIGNAEDDLFTYDPELNSVLAYDAAFREDEFQVPARTAPGLVGLRLLEAPEGARRILNGWPSAGDWRAGFPNEPDGWVILSGTGSYTPDHASNTIGHLVRTEANDMRMAVSAGPLTLAPGDSVVIRVALAFAEPETGTFTSGTVVDAGDPDEATRTIMQIAAPLRARLRAAESIR